MTVLALSLVILVTAAGIGAGARLMIRLLPPAVAVRGLVFAAVMSAAAGAFVAALVTRMDLAEREFDVVLGGSVLQAGDPLLTARIRERIADLAPGARLQVLDAPPVVGALASALALAGAAPEAAARVRETLRAAP